MIHLPYIRAIEEEEDCVTCQGREMFANASARLQAHGLSFRNVIRTWIYVSRLLDWYGEFNRIRSEHFNGEGLRRENGGVVFPASTAFEIPR
jgi:enamine deaminase RidA (YjgF/YER057c/UK114 family)